MALGRSVALPQDPHSEFTGDARDRRHGGAVRPYRGLTRPPLLVAGITMGFTLLNFVWLSFDTTPPHWDAANHLLSALRYRELSTEILSGTAGSLREILFRLVHIDQMVYPPLFPLVAGLLAPTSSIRSLVMMNSLFLPILLFSTYYMGRRVHSDRAGVLAALLVAAYPIVFRIQREFMVDFALLATTALSGCLLVMSDDFRARRATFLFGASTALGLLAKPTYASFIAVPACFVLVQACRRAADPVQRPAQLRGLLALAAGLTVGACTTALWYLPNYEIVRAETLRIAASNPIGFDVFDANSLVYYTAIMTIDQIGLPFMALFIYGLTVLRRHVSPAHFGWLMYWVAGIYVIATLAPYKGTGQDIGILIPVSVISAVGLAALPRTRTAVVTAVLVFAAAQAIALSMPQSLVAARIGSFRWAGSYQAFPQRGDWQIETALRSLGTTPKSVGLMSDDMHVNGVTVRYYVESGDLPFRVVERYGTPLRDLLEADVILAKSDWSAAASTGITRGRTLEGVSTLSVGVMYTRGQCVGERPDEPMANVYTRRDRELAGVSDMSLQAGHPYVRDYPLPDGSQLRVYSRRPFHEL